MNNDAALLAQTEATVGLDQAVANLRALQESHAEVLLEVENNEARVATTTETLTEMNARLAESTTAATAAYQEMTVAIEAQSAAMAELEAIDGSYSATRSTGLLAKLGNVAGGAGFFAQGLGALTGAGMVLASQGQSGGLGIGTAVAGGAIAGASIGSMVDPGLGTAIGGLVGAIGGLTAHLLSGGSSGSKTNAVVGQINAANPNAGELDNVDAMRAKAADAQAQLTSLLRQGAENQGGPGSKQNAADIQAVQAAYDQANTAVSTYNQNMDLMQKAVPGASMQNITQTAQNLGINLESVNTQTAVGTQQLQQLVTVLVQGGAAMDAAGTSASNFASRLGQVANDMAGKTGMQQYTITPDMIAQMQKTNAGLTAAGYDTRQIQSDTSMIAQAQGQTLGTDQALQLQQKRMEQGYKWQDLQHQLIDAQHAVVQANQNEANSEYSLNTAIFDVTKATNDLANAQFSLGQSKLKDTEASLSQTDSARVMKDALSGFTDKYATLNADLNQLLPNQLALGKEIVAEANTLQNLTNQYTMLNNQYTLASMNLQQINDEMQAQQDIANAPLQGQLGQQNAMQQNKMAQYQLQMQINQAELEGANPKSTEIINLQNKLDVLQKIGDQLQLQYNMTIGNEQFNITQAETSKYTVTYAQALQAAQSVGQLNTQITAQKIALDAMKPSVDAANTAMVAMQQKVEPLISALQGEEQANQQLVQANHDLVTSNQGVVDANKSLQDADHAVMTANQQVVSSQYQVQNASFQLQTVYHNMALQRIQDDLLMTQSIENYVKDYQTALGQLQMSQQSEEAQAALLATDLSNLTSGIQGAMAGAINSGIAMLLNPNPTQTQSGGAGLLLNPIAVGAGHAAGGLITHPGLFPMGEGSWPELVLPLANMGQSASLLAAHAPQLMQPQMSMSANITPSSSGGRGGVVVESGAIQVTVTGVAGAQDMTDEIYGAVEGALSQVLQAWG